MAIVRRFSDWFLYDYSAEHLVYEIDMLFGLAGTLSQASRTVVAPSVDDGRRVKNALIEAFGIHLRNVIDFLYVDSAQKTDVVASDFCTTGAWQAVRPAISKTLKDARVRANKELAHLTTARISGNIPQKSWVFASLANEVKVLLQVFVA